MEHGKPGIIYDRQGIRDLIEDASKLMFGVDYQESHLAGVLAALIKKGELESPERGKYTVVVNVTKLQQVDLFDFESYFPVDFSTEAKYSYEDLNDYEKIKNNVEKFIQDQIDYLKKINLRIPLGELDDGYLNNMIKIKELLNYLEKFQLS